MFRIGSHKLLFLLLFLVSLSPLRGVAMPQLAEAEMRECPQAVSVAATHGVRAGMDQERCAACQNGGCEDHQCNMALCGALHAPGVFLHLAVTASHAPHSAILVPLVSRDFSHRTEPPLIRPPIAFHS